MASPDASGLSGLLVPEDLVEFLESAVSIPFGTRDAQNRPASMRAMGVSVPPDRESILAHLPEATAERTLANLKDNGRVAVTFSRPSDYRSLQIKGRCVEVRPSTSEERTKQEIYLAGFVEELAIVGMAREASARLTYWPSVTVRVVIEAMFEQTPGPSAGKVLGRAAR